jgi:hypothetical protein
MIADGTVEAFRLQAHFCHELDSPLYGEFLSRAADDIEAGGPCATLLDGWQGLPMPDALPLRLLGAAHRLVLDGGAPELARFYPSAGGAPRWPDAWNALRDLIAERGAELRPALDRQVQTNEIRRSAALLGGFLTVAGRAGLPLRLLEIGSSGGLNLCWDRYRYEVAACEAEAPPAADAPFVPVWGEPDAAVVVRSGWHGSREILAHGARVATRAGCDIAVIDVTDPAQARTLESFVWADHLARLAQLRAAIAAVRLDPPALVRRAAADWLDEQLAVQHEGVATVVFHSIMWWYLSQAERRRVKETIAAAGSRATAAAPLAWLRLEVRGTPSAELRLRQWPGDSEQTLGHGDAQGRWVDWQG